MVFRFNLTIEIPASSSFADGDKNSLAPAQPTPALASNNEKPGLLQSARCHPRFSLRVLATIAVVAGLILNSIVQQNFWDYSIRDLCSVAFPLLCISLIWHPLEVYWRRLFKRPIPNWLLILVDTLGFVAFLVLFIGSVYVFVDGYRRVDSADIGQVVLFTWNTVPWVALLIVDFICMVQGARRAVRDRRIGRCPNCKDHVRGSVAEEEAHFEDSRPQGWGPEHTSEVEERYRDEES
ncbi:MAG: hypothetical protein Q9191_000468 [Dirinaria sp. TL-2023a]